MAIVSVHRRSLQTQTDLTGDLNLPDLTFNQTVDVAPISQNTHMRDSKDRILKKKTIKTMQSNKQSQLCMQNRLLLIVVTARN